MIAVVLDTVTGKSTSVQGHRSFEWAENNWSCDCNRSIAMKVNLPSSGVCDGCKRFIVIDAKFENYDFKYSLFELNEEYPLELLGKYGIVKEDEA